MDKSQLRRLALDYAHGGLRQEDYTRRRAALLEDIASGARPITREAPVEALTDLDVTLPSMGVPQQPQLPEPASLGPTRANLSPLHMGVGAGLLVLVVVVVVWLFAGGSEPPPAKVTTIAAPTPTISPARELVENFVAEKDFSERSIGVFQERWGAFSSGDHEEARGAPWFRRLVTAVVQEVKTQKALADLDGTGAAIDKARRLVEFGRFLGISEGMLPNVAVAGPTLPTPAVETQAPTLQTAARTPAAEPAAGVAAPPSAVTDDLSTAPVADPSKTGASPALVAPAAVPQPPRGRDWLHQQPLDGYTLQLFALNHLEKVESLIARHPELELHLVDYSPGEPRYRVLLGSFATADSARSAYRRLPEDVRRAQPTAFVRLVSEVLADEPTGTTSLAPAPAPAPAPTPLLPVASWLGQQPRERFTLQLFASNSRENAQRVVQRFPDLALALHESSDTRSRYRVLYGSFSTPEEARRAFNTLPAGLAEDAGLPLVKPIGELQDSETRASAN